MDIFRSKEIYRKIRKREEGQLQDPLVPIRGLYVVGEHMVPVYDNACVTIEKIETVHPKIVDYTQKTSNLNTDKTSVIGLIGMSFNDDLKIDRYTKKTVNLDTDKTSVIGLIGMSFNDGIDLLRYSKKTVSVDNQSTIGLLGMSFNDGLNIQRYYRKSSDMSPEPMVMITGITIEHCTITEGDV